MLARYGRRHWRPFTIAALAALLVVAARLLLPWPLRMLADQWLPEQATTASSPQSWLPAGLSIPVAMGLAFCALLVVLGLFDFIERLYFARFSIATVKDIRAAAFAMTISEQGSGKTQSGDLVARLVGDAARLKAGLKGFLVHVATNSVLFLGVIVVLFLLSSLLGWIFAGAALLTFLVTLFGATVVFRQSLRNREKEGKLANTIHDSLRKGTAPKRFGKLNRSSGRHEASVTRTSGIATWMTYMIFGAAVFCALWLGSLAVEAGELAIGDMLLFMMYALMMRGPIVRLARQGTRSGKIFGAGYRLAQIVAVRRAADAPAQTADDGSPVPRQVQRAESHGLGLANMRSRE